MITLDIQPQGEHFTFFSEPDPTAPSVEFELVAAPGSPGPDPHIHRKQVETFRVTAGEMVARLGKEERVVRAGETLVVPAGQAHAFRNGSATEPLIIRITVEPALNFQWYITEAARLAIANGGRWKDIPLLEVAYLVHVTRDENAFPGVPRFLQHALFAPLAGLAVLLGRHRKLGPKPSPVRGAPSSHQAKPSGEAA